MQKTLSWPEPPSLWKWIGFLYLSLQIPALLVFPGSFLLPKNIGASAFLFVPICVVPVSVIGVIFYLVNKRGQAKRNRESLIKRLDAIAMGGARCKTPTTIGVPNKSVILALFRDKFVIYDRKTFKPHFEVPLSAIIGIGLIKESGSLSASAMTIEFTENYKTFTGDFEWLEDFTGEEWKDKIMAIRQRGVASSPTRGR